MNLRSDITKERCSTMKDWKLHTIRLDNKNSKHGGSCPMIRAVFFDIDGTLIDTTTHTIPSSTITALRLLKENGYRICIASGRDMKNIQSIKVLDPSLFDGFVTSNGMCVFDHNFTCIQQHTFKKEDIAFLLHYAKSHQMTLLFETMDDIYLVNEINPYVTISNEYYHEINPPHKQWLGEEVVKITCFQALHYDFSEILANIDVQIIPTPTTTYDISIPGISKLDGIHTLMRAWGFAENAFLCFGDHENDRAMIQGASVGVAVKDALGSRALQAIADDVCESASNDGIYSYLRSHHYI